MSDDQGYHDVDTKRYDVEGIRFDNFYANSPVCSPTRASLISGLYTRLEPGGLGQTKKTIGDI